MRDHFGQKAQTVPAGHPHVRQHDIDNNPGTQNRKSLFRALRRPDIIMTLKRALQTLARVPLVVNHQYHRFPSHSSPTVVSLCHCETIWHYFTLFSPRRQANANHLTLRAERTANTPLPLNFINPLTLPITYRSAKRLRTSDIRLPFPLPCSLSSPVTQHFPFPFNRLIF